MGQAVNLCRNKLIRTRIEDRKGEVTKSKTRDSRKCSQNIMESQELPTQPTILCVVLEMMRYGLSELVLKQLGCVVQPNKTYHLFH